MRMNVDQAYRLAVERYQEYGVDAEAALARLTMIPVSLHCWQGDNVRGFEQSGGELLWFATGKDDFLLTTTQATLDLLKKHGFTPVFKERDGGHTWINWRDYLIEFTPQLFR